MQGEVLGGTETVLVTGRRNRVEVSVKGLMLAVVVIISLVISAMGIYLVTRARTAVNEGSLQFSQLMDEYSDVTIAMYDGMVVSGDRVMEAIDRFTHDKQVSVTVITKLNVASSGSDKGNLYGGTGWVGFVESGLTKVLRISDEMSPYESNYYRPSDTDYINPGGSFEGKVSKNENGIVTAIRFTQI